MNRSAPSEPRSANPSQRPAAFIARARLRRGVRAVISVLAAPGLAALGAHEVGEAPDRREDARVALGVVLDGHAVALLEHHGALECVDRVEPEALAEQFRVGLDLLLIDVLERERLDDQAS